MDNDALNSMNEFKRTVIAILERLRGLPQPRSRMALAAETRAAGVASLHRMMPTSTLTAVLVWLRASERISVIVFLATYFSYQSGWTYSDGAVSAPSMARSSCHGRAECDRRKIRLPAIALRTRNELNDLCTHAKASHNAMTTRPASASDIRYAVMSTYLVFAHCGRQCATTLLTRAMVFNMRQIARGGDLWGANLIPCLQGPRAAVAQATPRAGTFARTG